VYTFWDYKRRAWERDAGLRIDHLLVSSALQKRVRGAWVEREARGVARASDHAPVWLELR
ncbi:MAG TPA: exodeoxyribonuclease III, partial [Polyangiales bacterium]|nr:exodeoxyribonuclease III [Polyangiales bacterium]